MRPKSINPGVLCAISAGVLFGASTPLAKGLVHGIDPWMLAGLLYLGTHAPLRHAHPHYPDEHHRHGH